MEVASDAPLPRSSNSHSFSFMHSLLAMREYKAIAFCEFQLFADRYRMGAMKTIGEIRRDNLLLLVAEHGSIAALNVRLHLARTDATLSQIKNKSPDSKTKAPKSMGDAIARRIEKELELEVGWMDNPQIPHTYRNQKLAAAVSVMEAMDDDQLSRAVKIIDTLAEPLSSKRNGTES
jgi:hypothetical protein